MPRVQIDGVGAVDIDATSQEQLESAVDEIRARYAAPQAPSPTAAPVATGSVATATTSVAGPPAQPPPPRPTAEDLLMPGHGAAAPRPTPPPATFGPLPTDRPSRVASVDPGTGRTQAQGPTVPSPFAGTLQRFNDPGVQDQVQQAIGQNPALALQFLGNLGGGALEGLTAPESLKYVAPVAASAALAPLLGPAAPLVPAAISAFFAHDMANAAAEQIPEVMYARTPEERAAAAGQLAGTGLMLAAPLAHAGKGAVDFARGKGAPPAPTLVEQLKRPGGPTDWTESIPEGSRPAPPPSPAGDPVAGAYADKLRERQRQMDLDRLRADSEARKQGTKAPPQQFRPDPFDVDAQAAETDRRLGQLGKTVPSQERPKGYERDFGPPPPPSAPQAPPAAPFVARTKRLAPPTWAEPVPVEPPRPALRPTPAGADPFDDMFSVAMQDRARREGSRPLPTPEEAFGPEPVPEPRVPGKPTVEDLLARPAQRGIDLFERAPLPRVRPFSVEEALGQGAPEPKVDPHGLLSPEGLHTDPETGGRTTGPLAPARPFQRRASSLEAKQEEPLPEAATGAGRHMPTHEDVIRERAAKLGLSKEQIDGLGGDLLSKDPVTGFDKAEARRSNIERAQRVVGETGAPGVYVEMDIGNLGGLNGKFGHSGANKHFKALSDLAHQELSKVGEVHPTRHGGDEVSFTVLGATKERVDAAMDGVRDLASGYAVENGLHDIPHTKEGRAPGVGISYGTSEILHDRPIETIFSDADQRVETQKKGGSSDVTRGEAGKTGALPPGEQAGGAASGAGPADRAVGYRGGRAEEEAGRADALQAGPPGGRPIEHPAAEASGAAGRGGLLPPRRAPEEAVAPPGEPAAKGPLPEHVSSQELSRLDEKLSPLASVKERTRRVWERPNETPGPMVTGRSGYTMGKRLDAENDRKAAAFDEYKKAEREHDRLTAIREGYLAGTNHPNGQPRRPGAVEARREASARTAEKVQAQGFDTRKIHSDLSIDGKSALPDGREVSYEFNPDAASGGYRYKVTGPDGSEQVGSFHKSISRMQASGELRQLLRTAIDDRDRRGDQPGAPAEAPPLDLTPVKAKDGRSFIPIEKAFTRPGPEETAPETWAQKANREELERIKAEKAAKAAPPEAPKDAPLITGRSTKARTHKYTRIDSDFALVEAQAPIASHDTELNVNPAFPKELQPRDRTRVASEAQVETIARDPHPDELGEAHGTWFGAPIVGPDMIVESGNGRTIALRRAYQRGDAEAYREHLKENAERFGIKPEDVAGMKEPLLVRVRKTETEDRPALVEEMGKDDVAGMSATERARADAARISDDMLSRFIPNDDGNVLAATNRGFVQEFAKKVVGPDLSEFSDANGLVSQGGVTRLKNAVFAKAYGDTPAIARLAESTDNNVKSVTTAMLNAAPKLATVKGAIARGELHPIDFGEDLAAAAEKLSALRDENTSVRDYLDQQSMFGDDLSPEAKKILEAIAERKGSSKRLTRLFQSLAEVVEEAGDPRQPDLMRGDEVPTRAELLDEALKRSAVDKEAKQGSFFASMPDGRAQNRGVAPKRGPGGTTAETPKPGGKVQTKIVDDEGKPLRVYHGGSKDPFEAFKSAKIGGEQLGGALAGNWFAEDRSHAGTFGKVGEYYLDIRKPVEIDVERPGKWITPEDVEFFRSGKGHGFDGDARLGDILAEARRVGHDGAILHNWEGTGRSFIAFSPEQIRNAPSRSVGSGSRSPHEMTPEQFRGVSKPYIQNLRKSASPDLAEALDWASFSWASRYQRPHALLIRKALAEGQTVPAEVLAWYPQIKAPKSDPSAPTSRGGAFASQPHQAGMADGRAPKAGLSLSERVALGKKVAEDNVAAAGNAQVVELEEPGGLRLVVHPDNETPGRWRVTSFDSDGPSGHTYFSSREEAIRSASGSFTDAGPAVGSRSFRVKRPGAGAFASATDGAHQAGRGRGKGDFNDYLKNEGHPPPPKKSRGAGATPQRGAIVTKPLLTRASESVAKNVRGSIEAVQRTWAPEALGDLAQFTGRVWREKAAEFAHSQSRIRRQLEDSKEVFDRVIGDKAKGKQAMADFFDQLARWHKGGGRAQADPELRPHGDLLSQILEDGRKNAQSVGKLNQWIEDYFPHLWAEKQQTVHEWLQKRPEQRQMQGKRGWEKQRTIPTIAEGLKAGLTPVSWNPVDLVMEHRRQLDKVVMAHRIFGGLKDRGVVKFVGVDMNGPPAGWRAIDDPIAKVWGSRDVPIQETVDANLYEGLQQIAKTIGVKVERKPGIGGPAGATWDPAVSDVVLTKFGSPMGVLTHEIGHQLDFRYQLWDRLTGLKPTKGESRVVQQQRAAVAKELRDLADLRSEGAQPSSGFQKYAHSKEEKIANLIDAYVNHRERMRKVAPTVFRRLDDVIGSHPELHALKALKPSLRYKTLDSSVDAGGLVLKGQYFAPPEVADLIHNALSPGLGKNPLYRGWMHLNNAMNQVQLLGGFHAGFIALEAPISQFALGVQRMAAPGQRVQGLVDMATSPVAMAGNLWRGSKMVKDAFGNGPLSDDVKNVITAGGRFEPSSQHYAQAWDGMKSAWRQNEKVKAFAKAPAAAIEAITKPIFEYLVPRAKLGSFAKIADFELSRLGPNADPMLVRKALQRAWDSIDNRYGQMVYDNNFWNRTAKDLSHAVTRSVGWNFGSLREGVGAIADVAGTRARLREGDSAITPRMGYAVALAIVPILYGALLNGMLDQSPESLEDYYFPRTGGRNKDGSPERISLPTYLKDAYAYRRQPLTTLGHKTSPMVNAGISLMSNRDYYGAMIRDPNDKLSKQGLDVLKYMGSQLLPFSITGLKKQKDNPATHFPTAAGLVGATTAPAYITNPDKKYIPVEERIARSKKLKAEARDAMLSGR